ncbi:MAG: hypothetical protein FWH48_10860, partial [Oscillospiraceae bacterium]|nr:hypothetical protein [Oscillospiraceae bacterium]
MRDAQLAKAIDAIGDSSPEAKREILSGTAGITRQRLQGLAQGASEDEIKAIAETIEQGTYEKPKKAADVSPEAIFQGTCNECERYRSVHIQFTPIDLLEALNAVMAKMAQAYGENMRQLSSESDAAELRSALRGHIEMLEDLYRSI